MQFQDIMLRLGIVTVIGIIVLSIIQLNLQAGFQYRCIQAGYLYIHPHCIRGDVHAKTDQGTPVGRGLSSPDTR